MNTAQINNIKFNGNTILTNEDRARIKNIISVSTSFLNGIDEDTFVNNHLEARRQEHSLARQKDYTVCIVPKDKMIQRAKDLYNKLINTKNYLTTDNAIDNETEIQARKYIVDIINQRNSIKILKDKLANEEKDLSEKINNIDQIIKQNVVKGFIDKIKELTLQYKQSQNVAEYYKH